MLETQEAINAERINSESSAKCLKMHALLPVGKFLKSKFGVHWELSGTIYCGCQFEILRH